MITSNRLWACEKRMVRIWNHASGRQSGGRQTIGRRRGRTRGFRELLAEQHGALVTPHTGRCGLARSEESQRSRLDRGKRGHPHLFVDMKRVREPLLTAGIARLTSARAPIATDSTTDSASQREEA